MVPLLVRLEQAPETDACPVSPCDNAASQDHESDQQNDPTADAGAGAAAPKSEAPLQPVEQRSEQKQVQETPKAPSAILQ
jgi:hypothetical protein